MGEITYSQMLKVAGNHASPWVQISLHFGHLKYPRNNSVGARAPMQAKRKLLVE